MERTINQQADDLDVPVIDEKTFQNIRQIFSENQPELFQKLLNTYLSESKRICTELDSALSKNDWDALKRFSHQLKSCSANVGAIHLSNCCRELETSDTSSPQQHQELVKKIGAIHQRVCKELEAFCNGEGS